MILEFPEFNTGHSLKRAGNLKILQTTQLIDVNFFTFWSNFFLDNVDFVRSSGNYFLRYH